MGGSGVGLTIVQLLEYEAATFVTKRMGGSCDAGWSTGIPGTQRTRGALRTAAITWFSRRKKTPAKKAMALKRPEILQVTKPGR